MDNLDYTLRCNSLRCRAQLTERAVVTTCSHVFCVRCAEGLGLTTSTESTRRCPACQAELPNTDDVCITSLNPTEDYKTSVLSGLSPSIIMECAGRALAFYSYQAAQEVHYQEHIGKTLTDKYATLSGQMDTVILDANKEIQKLRNALQQESGKYRSLEEKFGQLQTAFQDRQKAFANTQHMYQKLKAQTEADRVATAATQNVESAFQAAPGSHRVQRPGRLASSHSPGSPHFASGIGGLGPGHGRQRSKEHRGADGQYRESGHIWNPQVQSGYQNNSSSQNVTLGTPSQRQPLPFAGGGSAGYISATHPGREGPIRRPGQDSTTYGNVGGYGMSSNMRIGRASDVRSPRHTTFQPPNLP